MNNIEVMFSSEKSDWSTPISFFEELDREFNFDIDVCANEYNHKCDVYYTEEDDGLSQDWGGKTCFCNPPYGKELKKWVEKAHEESSKPNTTIVLLIPARTDTIYFHEHIYHVANEIRFIKGRLHFNDSKNAAPFPSMVVVYRSEQ